MAARIVFADGSKQMAHNLNDLYERWQARREQRANDGYQAHPLLYIDTFAPELPELTTLRDALDARELLVQKVTYVTQRLAELNLSYQSGEMSPEAFRKARAPITAAVTRLNAQAASVNAAITLLRRTEQPAGAVAKTRHTLLITEAHNIVRQLKAKEEDGSITVAEQRELAFCRHVVSEHSLGAMLDKAAKDISPERVLALEKVLDETRKRLIQVQDRLLAAYERIIELEGGDCT